MGQGNPTDEKTIHTCLQQMEEFWNAHNFDAYDNLFADDATWVSVAGILWTGKAQIHKGHMFFNDIFFKYTSIKVQLQQLRFITNDVAIANIQWTFRTEQDVMFSDSTGIKKGDVRLMQITLTYLKKNKAWKISAGQNTNIDQEKVARDPVKDTYYKPKNK